MHFATPSWRSSCCQLLLFCFYSSELVNFSLCGLVYGPVGRFYLHPLPHRCGCHLLGGPPFFVFCCLPTFSLGISCLSPDAQTGRRRPGALTVFIIRTWFDADGRGLGPGRSRVFCPGVSGRGRDVRPPARPQVRPTAPRVTPRISKQERHDKAAMQAVANQALHLQQNKARDARDVELQGQLLRSIETLSHRMEANTTCVLVEVVLLLTAKSSQAQRSQDLPRPAQPPPRPAQPRRAQPPAEPSTAPRRGTCESRCLESGVSTDPEPCGFAHPRLAVRGFPVSGEKGILVVEPSPG
ncbi:putative protein TPRXL [Ixodes scapularis]